MSDTTHDFNSIAAHALSLTSQERGDLASRLIRSLDKDRGGTEAEHLAVVYERIKAYESGDLTTHSADDVIQEMRKKYGL